MGKVLLVNAYEVSEKILISDEVIKLLLIRTIEAANMTPVMHTLSIAHFPVLAKGSYKGEYGLSAGIVLVESHVYIHTWPEKRYMRYEMSSCRDFKEKEVLNVLRIILGKEAKIEYKTVPWESEDVAVFNS